jgi:hypothetical protein
MAYTTINKSSDHFNTLLYVGNGSNAHAITGVGFKPDFVWTKNRDSATDHYIHDIVRGVEKAIRTNNNSATYDTSINLQSFDTDGFTLGTQDGLNKNGDNIVSWNWLAGGSQGSSNTDGSINTTYTSVNTTAGISISSYTGTGATATVGHGLGAVPKVVLIKGTSNTGTWGMYHSSLGAGRKIILNTDADDVSSGWMNSTAPTNQVFTVINDTDVGTNGYTYVAYSFAEKTGFSKFGKYTGNGNADGTFVYTGFKPAFVIIRNTSTTGNWNIMDTARNPGNIISLAVSANTSGADDGGDFIDILSNGFKPKSTSANRNASDNTYIFLAFAEAPLVGSNNIPCTAR